MIELKNMLWRRQFKTRTEQSAQAIFDDTELGRQAIHNIRGCNTLLFSQLHTLLLNQSEADHQICTLLNAQESFCDDTDKALASIAAQIYGK